jgi:hypothetical protein
MPASVLDPCERLPLINIAALEAQPLLERAKARAAREIAWETRLSQCETRGDARLGIAADSNRRARHMRVER